MLQACLVETHRLVCVCVKLICGWVSLFLCYDCPHTDTHTLPAVLNTEGAPLFITMQSSTLAGSSHSTAAWTFP